MKFYKKTFTILFACILILLATAILKAQETNVSEWMQKASNAGIEQSVLSDFQNRVQGKEIDSKQVESIIKSAISMSEENLPAEVAIQKALEGFSKGIPAERVAMVIDQVHESVRQAAEIVDPWMNRPEVRERIRSKGQGLDENKFRNELAKATSRSIMQNIPAEAVSEALSEIGSKSILAKSSPSDVVAAMGILPDLPSSSDQPQASGKFIARALEGGFKADELQKLPSAIKVAQQRSELPAASVIEGVANQMRGNIPAKEILKNLFDGKVGGGPPGDIPRGLRNNNNKGQGNSNNGT